MWRQTPQQLDHLVPEEDDFNIHHHHHHHHHNLNHNPHLIEQQQQHQHQQHQQQQQPNNNIDQFNFNSLQLQRTSRQSSSHSLSNSGLVLTRQGSGLLLGTTTTTNNSTNSRQQQQQQQSSGSLSLGRSLSLSAVNINHSVPTGQAGGLRRATMDKSAMMNESFRTTSGGGPSYTTHRNTFGGSASGSSGGCASSNTNNGGASNTNRHSLDSVLRMGGVPSTSVAAGVNVGVGVVPTVGVGVGVGTPLLPLTSKAQLIAQLIQTSEPVSEPSSSRSSSSTTLSQGHHPPSMSCNANALPMLGASLQQQQQQQQQHPLVTQPQPPSVSQQQHQQHHSSSTISRSSQQLQLLSLRPSSTPAVINESNSSASISADEGGIVTDCSVMGGTTTSSTGGEGQRSPTPIMDLGHQICTGPTELYRLIASSEQHHSLVNNNNEEGDNNWEIILSRALSHPHEACFYDPNCGGHVYALHRLLRCTGNDQQEDNDNCSGEDEDDYGGRPPPSVVEAVMKACPRAVTRKQAVMDEEDLMSSSGSVPDQGGGGLGGNHNAGGMEWQAAAVAAQQLPQVPPAVNVLPNQQDGPVVHPPNGQGDGGDDNEEEDRQEQPNEEEDLDNDVRFEYPLAIACECEQDGEIVRLLASYLAKTKPEYRSEVFRSLDYASLPNHLVRILLEEYAGCVLERGMNSEATEGDDDDCPLEQVLFWWDDPDMMGMEEDISNYPNCNMKEDLSDLWEKLRMMLYAAKIGSMAGYDDSKESFQVLHHVLRIVSNGGIQDVRFPNDFAHSVLLLAKFIQRERASMFEERDDSGSLPVHLAVSGTYLLRASDPKPIMDEEQEDNEEDGQDSGNDQLDQAMDGVVPDAGPAQEGGGPQGNQEQLGAPAAVQPQAEEYEDDEEEDEDGEHDDAEGLEDPSSKSSDLEIVKLVLEQHPASIRLRDSQSGSLPVHLALQHNPRATEAIDHFLDLYPRSVTMPDGNGRLPIHMALLKQSPTWRKIVSLSPIALETRDPVTGLLPFQLAAMSNEEEAEDEDEIDQESSDQQELDSLSTCFSLLRMSPCLASGLAVVKQRPQSLIEQQIMIGYKPRVTKLEEENERLRCRVEELERKLLHMEMSSSSDHPQLKKRKSSSYDFKLNSD